MKNIVIITPFYPFPNKSYLIKDSNVVYYLTENKKEEERIIIIFYYQHTRRNAFINFPRIFRKQNYQQCLYQDDRGNDVLLFEHPCLVPKSYHTIKYFDDKYADFFNKYLNDRGIVVDSMIVHFPVRFTPLASKINAKRKVAICHSFDVEKGRDKVTREYCKQYNDIGFRSPQIRNVYYQGIKTTAFLCLSGVPNKYLEESQCEREWKPNGVLRICFAGRLVKNKNLSNVFKALNLIKDKVLFRMTVIGDGEELENLQKECKLCHLEDKVIFLGKLDRDEVYSEFLKNDIFIMVSFKETLGLVYLEAMAAGALVIASRGRGIDGLVEENQGARFVDPNSIIDIAEAIETYYQMDKKEVIELKNKMKKMIFTLSESSVSRKYLEFSYDDCND